jgi:Mannosylglycerate hydrolase MGH1-like glycoside hydrolase domain
MTTAERLRLDANHEGWKRWGPYLAERAWATVREDYSKGGDVWDSFTHDQAQSRAYRWNEDGLGAICDDQQRLCFAFAFWNGRDPILKERIFGLTGTQGNHGEDAKEYWFYVDSTPTHSWMRWRYMYSQNEFPYQRLIDENRSRGHLDPEFELADSGIFDDGKYFEITADYAKATPDDWCIELRVRNAGAERAELHVLPTLWFRNTWSWGIDDRRPTITVKDGSLVAEHDALGTMILQSDGAHAMPLTCENESNAAKLWGQPATARAPKDGINDHVVRGAPTVNDDEHGTKAALWMRLTIGAGATEVIRLRLGPDGAGIDPTWHETMIRRAAEADEFYAAVTPDGVSPEDAMIMRQAFAGMMWGKQWYHYDVQQWLDGDPAGPPPPAERWRGRNREWRHLNNADIISMPDVWEYPWYAAWDLAFHCVAIAHIDPQFAKDQLILVCREWYMHPNGQLPAYEWQFGDVNPPVQAWAAMRVFEIDGSEDFDFLEKIMHKLLLNFTWWINRKDANGNNVFEGGFLGLDNIGPIDRSARLPVAGHLEQSDGTAWMAMYCLDLLEMSLVLANHSAAYEDIATKFFEHFTYIAEAVYSRGLWDDVDGFYYDVLHFDTGERVSLRVRSMVGLLPLVATTTLGTATLVRLPNFAGRCRWFAANKPEFAKRSTQMFTRPDGEGQLLSIVSPEQLDRVLHCLLDEREFLSPHGIRALSAWHRDHPFELNLGGSVYTVDYEPGESTTALFGGNSNWRGPIWFPVNYLVIESIRRFARFLGDTHRVEFPSGSGVLLTLGQVADQLSDRLVTLFRNDGSGRRPCFGSDPMLQTDPAWHDNVLFHEYFHGDTGAGLGASHQTGWTGLVADLIIRRAKLSQA